MANDFGSLQTQIATDLRRSNLGAEIAQAILDAITDHDGERFWFNDALAPYTFTAVPGGGGPGINADDYTLNPQPPIQEFVKVDYVRANPMTDASGMWYTMKKAENFEIDVLRSIHSSGQPARWAMLETSPPQLRIWPTPANATGYPIRVYGHYRLTPYPLVNSTDANAWTSIAKNLIRYTALKRLFVTPIRDTTQMQLMEAAGVRELEYLRRETEQRKRKGRMRAYG